MTEVETLLNKANVNEVYRFLNLLSMRPENRTVQDSSHWDGTFRNIPLGTPTVC